MSEDFLACLWPQHGVAELRVISQQESPDNIGTKHVEQMFYPLAGHDDATPEEMVQLISAQARYFDSLDKDVYFGVLPRIRAGGAAKDCYPNTSVLWADIDAKKFEDGKDAALQQLGAFEIPPQAGHRPCRQRGYHVRPAPRAARTGNP